MQISIVIPLKNEDESLPELEAWIRRVCDAHRLTYEIIMVDDGSTDGSWKVIQALQAANPNVRGIKFRRNYGKSAGLHTGFQASRGLTPDTRGTPFATVFSLGATGVGASSLLRMRSVKRALSCSVNDWLEVRVNAGAMKGQTHVLAPVLCGDDRLNSQLESGIDGFRTQSFGAEIEGDGKAEQRQPSETVGGSLRFLTPESVVAAMHCVTEAHPGGWRRFASRYGWWNVHLSDVTLD